MKTLSILILSLLLTSPAFADRTVRDRHGNLTETWTTRNGSTEVRDRHGDLVETRTPRGRDVEIRDRGGNYQGSERWGR